LFVAARTAGRACGEDHLKDRWRQILNEAERIPVKHLLTLQEGISLNQFGEMEREGVVLVIPKELQKAFHPAIQPKVVSLEEFIANTRNRCIP
jgi:hypothetical protein